MFQIVKSGTTFDFIGKQKIFLFLSAILILGSVALLVLKGPNYGIDFRGGSDLILKFDQPITSEEVRAAAAQAGFEDASVQRFGTEEQNQFLVQTRAVSVVNEEKISDLLQTIGTLGPLAKQETQWSKEQPDRLEVTFAGPLEGAEAKIKSAVEGMGLEKVEVEESPTDVGNTYVIRFEDLANKVRDGFGRALPGKFNPALDGGGLLRLETVGESVSGQLREDGLTAVLLSLVAILIYIAVRFDIRYAPGAVIALFHDVTISMGILALIGMEINLPILASVLTIVGYSLNDTIVVFDRIRENYSSGRGGHNLREITNTSLNETLSRTLITSLTTLFAVVIIWWLGSGLISSFAFTLIIGVIIGTYSSIFVASPILLVMDTWLHNRQRAKELRASRQKPVMTVE